MPGPLGTSGGGAAGVTSVTAGNGITVSGTTTPTVSASLAAGTGIGISGTTTLSVSNTGVTSIVAGTNVSVSGATGTVTVNAPAYGTTITASTIGGTAAAGTSTGVAREDHKHAFPAGAAPSALTVASTQATGTSTSPALADHVHAMPGSATAGASAVGDTAATGTATTVALSDHRHSREAFGTPVVVNGQTTSLATGSLTTLARADHVHTMSNVPALLASTTLGSDTASFTWSSIPQTYTHLQVHTSSRTSTASAAPADCFEFNGDTSSSYRTVTDALFSCTYTLVHHGSTNYYAADLSPAITVINNYTGATFKHIFTSFAVNLDTTANNLATGSWHGLWRNTAAITSIRILTGGVFRAGSRFFLYGFP